MLVVSALLVVACSNAGERSLAATEASQAHQSTQPADPAQPQGPTVSLGDKPVPEFDSALPASVLTLLQAPFTGDLNEMVTRRMIRKRTTR